MAKRIKIEKKLPLEELADHCAGLNEETIKAHAKNYTDKHNDEEFACVKDGLVKFSSDAEMDEIKKNIKKSSDVLKRLKEQTFKDKEDKIFLTEDEEKEIMDKIDKGRVDEIVDAIDELDKPYKPGEDLNDPKMNIHTAAGMNELKDFIKLAANFAKLYKEKHAELREEEFKRDWAISEKKKRALEELVDKITKPKTDPVAKAAYKVDKMCKPGQIIENDNECNECVKKEYVSPKCRIIEEEDLKHEDKKPVAGWFNGICQEMMGLHERKNKDYGNAAHESYEEFGLISYVIRLNDKMKRLKSLIKPGVEQEVKSESIEDTLMDLAAYAIMAIESLRWTSPPTQ